LSARHTYQNWTIDQNFMHEEGGGRDVHRETLLAAAFAFLLLSSLPFDHPNPGENPGRASRLGTDSRTAT